MSEKKRALALGFFDGMHRAHRAVVGAAVAYASAHDMIPTAVTFDHHPQAALQGSRDRLINTLEERIEAFRALGVEDVIVLPFDTVRDIPWDVFLQETVLGTLRAGFVATGYDFRFGEGGKGTAQMLADALKDRGIAYEMIARMADDGMEYASGMIRAKIAEGDMASACRMLGRPHYITGEVIHGKALGRTIGSPTMNVAFSPDVILPRAGVYATHVVIDGTAYPSVTNVAGGDRPLAEAYVFDFNRDVYGKIVRIEFLEFLRDMRPFASLDALRAQITADKETARAYFANAAK